MPRIIYNKGNETIKREGCKTRHYKNKIFIKLSTGPNKTKNKQYVTKKQQRIKWTDMNHNVFLY